MSVTRDDVLHVARLARLELSEQEVERFTSQLNSILAHVSELEAADLGSAGPVLGAAEWPAPLRTDQAGPDALACPPAELSLHSEAGFFTVPRLAALDADAVEGGA